MMIDSSFEIATPDVVAEDFGEEIVVLNLANGKYYSLLGVACDLWQDITGGARPQDLLVHLETAQNKNVEAVRAFVLNLIREELIRPTQPSSAPISPDQAKAIISLNQGAEPPRLEVFNDMAELILSDPIHDVDEDIGWPVQRSSD